MEQDGLKEFCWWLPRDGSKASGKRSRLWVHKIKVTSFISFFSSCKSSFHFTWKYQWILFCSFLFSPCDVLERIYNEKEATGHERENTENRLISTFVVYIRIYVLMINFWLIVFSSRKFLFPVALSPAEPPPLPPPRATVGRAASLGIDLFWLMTPRRWWFTGEWGKP